MNGNPSRQMIVIAIAVAVVIVGFLVFRFAPSSAAPEPSPSASSQPLQAEPEATDNNDEQSFHGVQCNPDCSEVISGYNDAQNSGVKSRSDCPDEGTVQHQQGCWAYADEQQSGGGQNSGGQSSNDQNSSDQNSDQNSGSP